MNQVKIVLFILFYSINFCLFSQTEHRKALLIGNKDYVYYNKLKNSIRDVDAMNTALKDLGFETTVKKNLEYRNMSSALNAFVANLKPDDIALIYYSGHGIGHNGYNFMLPIEESFNCLNELEDLIPISINRVVKNMEQKGVKNSFVFLDACRNLPNFKDCSGEKGINKVGGLVIPNNNPKGNLIFFATTEGNTADDDTYDNTNSLFTSELLKYITIPDLTIRTIVDKVTNGVEKRSNSKQVPQKLEDMRGDFYFIKTSDEEKARLATIEKQKEQDAIKAKLKEEYDKKLKEEITKLEKDKKNKVLEKQNEELANKKKETVRIEKEKLASNEKEEAKILLEKNAKATNVPLNEFKNTIKNGDIFYEKGQYDNAISAYDEALAITKKCEDCIKMKKYIDNQIFNAEQQIISRKFKNWKTGVGFTGIILGTAGYFSYATNSNWQSKAKAFAEADIGVDPTNSGIITANSSNTNAYTKYLGARTDLENAKKKRGIYLGTIGAVAVAALAETFLLIKKPSRPQQLRFEPAKESLGLALNYKF